MKFKSTLLRFLLAREKSFKKIDETFEYSIFKCIDCGAISKVHKNYGSMHVVCGCGNKLNIYTGRNLHKKKNKQNKTQNSKNEGARNQNKRKDKLDIFNRNIHNDLMYLAEKLWNKRDIRKQLKLKKVEKIFKGGDPRLGCEKALRYLQEFCDLNKSTIRLTFEQLTSEKTLKTKGNSPSVLGTTYTIPMGLKSFYTIYINPDILLNHNLTIATIAHELSHVYAHNYNLNLIPPNKDRGDNEYNEQMTDLLGIALGMGPLMADKNYSKEPSDTGYLSSELVFKAQKYWLSNIISGKTIDVKTSVNCPICGQKLRIPISNRKIEFKCPKCNHKF